MKNGFVVRVAVKANILIIALCVYFPAIGAEAINRPSVVESAAMPTRDEWPELGNGSLQGGESSTKNVVDCHAVARPLDGVRVESIEGGKHSGTEGCASVRATSLEVVAPDKVSNKSGTNQTAGYEPNILYDNFKKFLQGALFGLLIAVPMFLLGDAGPYGKA